MVRTRVIALCLTVGAASLHAAGKKLDFIDANLEGFVHRVITQDDERNQFKVYYSHLSQKMQQAKDADPEKERATYRYLYNLALERLQEKHAEWYQEIAPFVNNPALTLDEHLHEVRKMIRFFLTRYGAYEEFLNYRQAHAAKNTLAKKDEENGVWHTIKGYVTSAKDYVSFAKDKVVVFLGFGSKQETV